MLLWRPGYGRSGFIPRAEDWKLQAYVTGYFLFSLTNPHEVNVQWAINPPTNRSFFSSLSIVAELPVAFPQLLTSEKSSSQLSGSEIDIKLFIPMKSHAIKDNFCYYLICFGGGGERHWVSLYISILLMLKTSIYSFQQALILFPEFVWWAELTTLFPPTPSIISLDTLLPAI